jgi:hypothetical protein
MTFVGFQVIPKPFWSLTQIMKRQE